MASPKSKTAKGRESSQEFKKQAAAEEQKVESVKGSPLKKGAERFEERSKSSDGKSAGEKQVD
ncbi:hypothetical protein [Ensifer adhaerens]|uniref:hypothetical protein n=1 Tax=Ensifer adhaerens TaxID=106592 RepID=UPI000CF0C1DF|nr:hypothetical protein [Ensifer adhaerens]